MAKAVTRPLVTKQRVARWGIVALVVASAVACRGAESDVPSGWRGASGSMGPRCAFGGIRPTTSIGVDPAAVVLTDLDRDGRVDAVVARPAAHLVVVARGLGDGTFAEGLPIRVQGLPVALAAADIDGDRTPEVVILEAGVPRVSVLVGGPQGPRIASSTLLVGAPPEHAPVLVTGDIDGDGAADVLVTDDRARGLVILAGTRTGSLAPPRLAFVASEAPRAVALGDFDGNRTVDVALATSQGITFLSGDGRGTFTAVPRAASRAPAPPDAPAALAAFPAPSLGRDALVVRSDEGAHTLVGFGATSFSIGGAADGRVRGLAVADVDRDGVSDLISLSNDYLAVVVRRIDPAKLLRSPAPRGAPVRLPDLDEDPRAPEVLRSRELLAGGKAPIAMAVADLDGDGAVDVVDVDRAGYLGAVMNRGDGTFRPTSSFEAPTYATGLVLADVNGDGEQDVVVHSTGALPRQAVTSYLRRGSTVTPVSTPLRPWGHALGVLDADGDGRRDALIFHLADRAPNRTLMVHRGTGDGRFDPNGVPFALPAQSQQIAFADVDGDRASDVIIGTQPGEIYVLRNLLQRGFAPPLLLGNIGSEPREIVVEDLDGDRRPDVLVACSVGVESGVAVFWASLPVAVRCVRLSPTLDAGLARASARLFPQVPSTSGSPGAPVGRFAIDDLDGDGRRDIVYGDVGDFLVAPGLRDDTFGMPQRFRLRNGESADGTGQERLNAATVLRGGSGQGPALVVATQSHLSILPRVCWAPR